MSPRPKRPPTACSVHNCYKMAFQRGLCRGHYMKWYRGAHYLPIADPVGQDRLDPAFRFWEKVQTGPGCWMWLASRHKGKWEYGRFHDGERMVPAHVFSYRLHYGEIPEGLFVCHHCDNPPCVRPDHLFLGTQLDNMADAKKKGRPIGRPRTSA